MGIEYRKLGRTGLKVSEIGLGTEYLNQQPRRIVTSVVQQAIEQGVNYFDIVFSFPRYLDNLGAALKGRRKRLVLTGHLGSTEKNGQYFKTRNAKRSEAFFLDVLARLDTDYVDVLFLHNFNTLAEYESVTGPGGLLELAGRLWKEGKARCIGISTHSIEVAHRAIASGQIDVLMFPIHMAANAVPGKKDLLQACVSAQVGVVAMKPFAGGKLLREERSIRVARYQMGGGALKLKKPASITPVQCLSYVLSQVGVTTAVPGCANLEQLEQVLAYGQATEEEKDFGSVLSSLRQYESGECVYCNHCLPCPSAIDVGQVIRLVEMAQRHLTDEVRAAYRALEAKASDCTKCGACKERCPFGVDVIAKMEQAVAVFG
jgi:predicted aldo/keto reductase-like oxidoreductase